MKDEGLIQWAEEDVLHFQQALLTWFHTNKRALPWRETTDPYKIWVSEVMLQQTRVDTVIPYYEKFIERYPTLNDLAQAEEAEVLKLWEGLGYYSRARNLLQGVREVAACYGGRIPDTKEDILTVKGIGPYTAGAILSIAYGRPVPAVDGNVLRVVSRLFAVGEDITRTVTKKRIEALVEQLIPERDASSFNQGLMELGSLVCLPRGPKCHSCPVRRFCRAHQEGRTEAFPVKAAKSRPKPVGLAAAVLWRDGQVLIRRRPETGLLAGMWEFPTAVWDASFGRWEKLSRNEKVYWLREQLEATLRLQLERPRYLLPIRHVFSHLKWVGEVYEFHITPVGANGTMPQKDATSDGRLPIAVLEQEAQEWRWAEPDELAEYAFPVPYRKIVQHVLRLTQES